MSNSPPPSSHMSAKPSVIIASAMVTFSTLAWAGNWVIGRAIRADIGPLSLNYWRWTLAMALLAIFAWPQIKGDWPLVRKHWRFMVGASLSGTAIFHSMIYIGLHSTQAINAMLLNSVGPIFVILMSWLAFRDTISWRQTIGIGISLIGVIIIIARGDGATLMALQFNIGDLWILGALAIWGVYSLFLKRRPQSLGGLSMLFYMSLIGSLFLLPGYIWEMANGSYMKLDLATVATVLYLGIFAALLAYLGYNKAALTLGTNVTSFFLHLIPVFGSALAIIFLGEQIYLYHFIGFAVVLFGIYLSTSKLSS